MGLLWSEHLVRAASAAPGPTVTTLRVTAGGRRIGSGTVTQLLSGPGVTEHVEALAKVGFVGRDFPPPGRARHPTVIVWGGSEGGLGDSPEWAALLASHGIAALAIAYFDEPGLPCALENIPLEYFEKAIEWLRSEPQVDPRRVWILSGSRGSEADLLVAAHWPTLVRGVIATAPSSVVWGTAPGHCQPLGLTAWDAAWTAAQHGCLLRQSDPEPRRLDQRPQRFPIWTRPARPPRPRSMSASKGRSC